MAMIDGQADTFDLDAIAVSDRFRLFGFTRRDDYVAYLWVLRALDRLRGAHVAQAHTDDVAEVLAEFATAHETVTRNLTSLRGRLDNLVDDGLLHRLEDASRAGSLARYRNRNRQSVYQFSELGHRAYTAVEGVLAARVEDANLSRLVFSDTVRDLHELAEANRDQYPPGSRGTGRRAAVDAVRRRPRRLGAPVDGRPGLVLRRQRGIPRRRAGRCYPRRAMYDLFHAFTYPQKGSSNDTRKSPLTWEPPYGIEP
jgi:hypothetical protein